MTFYSLATGTKTVVQNDDWHLAISIRPSLYPETPLGGTTIRHNGQLGTRVYYVPNARAATFSSLDTTGWHSWKRLYDSDTSVDEGCLNSNRNLGYFYDFGWGVYNPNSHNVVGDSLYLIQLPDGQLKKFIVVNLAYDTAYNIKYANIDNSDSVMLHFSKRDYIGKEFVYLNLSNNQVMDKEPLSSDWDLQFLKYQATDVLNNQHVPIVGVWQNEGTLTAKRDGHDIGSNDYSNLSFSHYLNAIGWNWKYPGNIMSLLAGKNILDNLEFYLTRDSLAYFVQTRQGEVYKLVFTKYVISSGQINFFTQKLTTTGIVEAGQNSDILSVYPNPASSTVNVTTALPSATLRIVDITGRIVHEEVTTGNPTPINTSDYPNGMYLLMVSGEGKTSVRKFEVSR
jgi:hypothetical protein